MGRDSATLTENRLANGLILVEFFGVPGVGKSYLAKNAVSPRLHRPMDRFSEGTRTQRISRKLLLMLRHMPTAVAAGFWASKLSKLYPSSHRLRRIKVLFNWVFIDCVVREAACCGNPTVVLDQGIAQALWSTQFGANDYPADELRALIQQYLPSLPISDWKVVRVAASYEVVLERVKQREGFSPVDHDICGLTEAFAAERKITAVIKQLEQSSSSKPNIRFVDVDNSGCQGFTDQREALAYIFMSAA